MPLHDPDDPFESLVFLSADGKIEGRVEPKDQRRAAESWVPPEPPPLELNPDGYPIPPEPVVPDEAALAQAARERQHKQLAIAAAVVVILFAAAAFLLLRAPAGGTASQSAQEGPSDGAAAFTVQSEPPGASVFIGDEVLGTTPFLGTNDVAPGQQVKVRLELHGYADWTGSVTGGRNVNLVARLKRK